MDAGNQSTGRRDFLGLTASAAAIGIGGALPIAASAATDGPSTDFTRWLDTIHGKHRAVMDVREPLDGMGLVWTWVFLHTATQAYGVTESELGAVMVLRHSAIPIALQDRAWKKYRLGAYFKINDPATGQPAERNPFYENVGAPLIPDMALHKLIDRGVRVGACAMAIFHYSGEFAKELGQKHEDVRQDWMASVLPDVTVVPSGVVACQGAAARGCGYLFAG